MLKRGVLIVFLIILIFPVAFAGTKIIHGYLLDYQNNPISSHTVTLYANTTSGICATNCITGDDGHYTCNLGNLNDGNCSDLWKSNDSLEVYVIGENLIPTHLNYSYITSISDGSMPQLMPNITLSLSPNIPNLTNPSLNPSSGNENTVFNFTIEYTDYENNAPASINVTINGTNYQLIELNSSDNIYNDGKGYYNSTTLSYGSYAYSFIASDGNYSFQTQTVYGPVVDDITPPRVISKLPGENQEDVNISTKIVIQFSEKIDESTLTNSNIILEGGNEDILYTISYNSSSYTLTITPKMRLKYNTEYEITLSNGIKDINNNALTQLTWEFDTEEKDSDRDGTPDNSDNDDDNDGIIDSNDVVNGDSSSIRSNLDGLKVRINGSDNLASSFSGDVFIQILNNSIPLIEFDIDLSSQKIDLAELTVIDDSNISRGAILVHNLTIPSSATKTVYLSRTNSGLNGICIRDAETTKISQISELCGGSSETKVECDGTNQNSYSCSLNSSINMYKVTGLKYSAVKQFDYERPEESNTSTTTPAKTTTTTSSGGGGAGSSEANAEDTEVVTEVQSSVSDSGGECSLNEECTENERCFQGFCLAIECPSGSIVDHACVYDTCEKDEDCGTGFCSNNNCVMCLEDADCGNGKICSENNCVLTINSINVKAPNSIHYGERAVILIKDKEGKPLEGVVVEISDGNFSQNYTTNAKGEAIIRILSYGPVKYTIDINGEIITGEIKVKERGPFTKLFSIMFTIIIFIFLSLLVLKGKQHNNFEHLKDNFILGIKQLKHDIENIKKRRFAKIEEKRLRKMPEKENKLEKFKKNVKEKEEAKEYHDLLEDEDLNNLE